MMIDIKELKFDEKGLIPVIVQDVYSDKVLMMAYMNMEALNKSIQTKEAYYFSRSRQELWHKGETSGHYQYIKEMCIDCDGDSILIKVEQIGAACHTNNLSCFYRKLKEDGEFTAKETENAAGPKIFNELYKVVLERKINPKEGSYTNYLFDKGIDKILKKVGEENAEVIIAAKNSSKEELTYEISDLLYHLIVLMVEKELSLEEIYKELEGRRK